MKASSVLILLLALGSRAVLSQSEIKPPKPSSVDSSADASSAGVLLSRLHAEEDIIAREEKSLRELQSALLKAEKVKPGGYRIHLSQESLDTISKAATLATVAQATFSTAALLKKMKISKLSKAAIALGAVLAIDSSIAAQDGGIGNSVLFHLTNEDIEVMKDLVYQSQQELALYKARREVIRAELLRQQGQYFEEPQGHPQNRQPIH